MSYLPIPQYVQYSKLKYNTVRVGYNIGPGKLNIGTNSSHNIAVIATNTTDFFYLPGIQMKIP